MKPEIKLYYKNVMAKVIGDEHGITGKQRTELAEKIVPLIPVVMNEIAGVKRHPKITNTRYGLLPKNTSLADEIMERAEKLKGRYENLVVLGIGGSALGNIALQTALNPYMYNLDDKVRNGRPRLFVFDNVDPAQLSSFMNQLGDGLKRTLFNVISKSGRTAETAAQFLYIKEKLASECPEESPADHIIVTTGFETNKEGQFDSTLYRIAEDSKLPLLEVPKDVGGRFTVLSAVGLFGAAMCGIDIYSLLEGARDMHERVSRVDFEKNPAVVNAAINYHYYNHGKKNSVIMPYAYALKDMADWYRQLWAESLGKAEDLDENKVFVGPTPVKALGVTDQHSQVQLYREGPNDKLFTFLQVENFGDDLVIGPAPDCAAELEYLAGKKMSTLLNSEKKATEYALIESKRPCLTVLFPELNAYTVGQFIYLYEVTTSFAGALFNIDTYNQPAVELGKEATFALMGKSGYEKLSQQIQPVAEVDDKFLV
jgi:glucose-6-phosphate isomerase